MAPESRVAEVFVEAVTKIVQILRYGPRELALAVVGFLLFGAAKLLPDPEKAPAILKPALPWIPWALFLGGGLLLTLAVFRIWKKAVAPLPEAKPKPSAIKGPAPFGPQDAELFAKLGRNDDLDRLRSWVLDDQKPLIALMGESGVGKTSLLRAGLAHHLRNDGVSVLYWEALPTDPDAGLLHAIRSGWEDPEKAPKTLQDLVAVVASPHCVVVDQVEQLSPERHPRIFELLWQIATANPPYRTTWVVAFRREYLPVWRDFELSLPEVAQRRMETSSLQKFFPKAAEKVIAVLVAESGLAVEQRVVQELVEGVTAEGKVSPADIGISLLVLSELTGDEASASFSLTDFRARGGQAGLLTRYLERLLEQFPQAERREILKALLALIDLEKDQRLAEGRTLEDLENTLRPVNPARFAATLKFLASGKARVLEKLPGTPPLYRLVHERLIPAVRRLTGVLLAEAEQAGLTLESSYRIWSRNRRSRYLLTGRELRKVRRFRAQLTWGADAADKREYLRLSHLRSAGVWALALMALLSLGSGIVSYVEVQSRKESYRGLLEGWGLPRDLYDHLGQLEQLSLPTGITRLDWLDGASRLTVLHGHFNGRGANFPASLQELELRRPTYIATIQLPANLTRLALRKGVHLRGVVLPASLISLEIEEFESFRFPRELPENLKALSIRHYTVNSLANLPPGLELLDLKGTRVNGVISLPANLKTLSISVSEFRELRTMPQHLHSLTLASGNVTALADLPETIRSLILEACRIESLELPSRLESLVVRGSRIDHMGMLPRSLEFLQIEESFIAGHGPASLAYAPYVQPLTLQRLRSLSLAVATQQPVPQNLRNLPPGLKALTLRGFNLSTLESLPSGLEFLDLTGAHFSHLPQLPVGLRSLRLASTDLHRLEALPEGLQSLDISHTRVSNLAGLPPRLEKLNLLGTLVPNINGMPPTLRELWVDSNVPTLDPLPRSVRALHLERPD